MNVLKAQIGVIPVQRATTLMGVTPALATLDSQAMAVLVQVSTAILHCYTASHQSIMKH